MDKKELKWYETPAAEVVELEIEAQLLAGSAKTDPFNGNTEQVEEEE